jgi:endonuclease G, mitochondrial
MRRITTLFSALILVILLAGSIHATSLLTEDFNYTAGTLLTTHGWVLSSGTGGIAVTSPGLTYSGVVGSGVGNAVTLTGATSEDDHLDFSSSVTTGTVYASAMVNVTTITSSGADYVFMLGTGTGTFQSRVFIRKDATSGFDFGFSKVGTSTSVIQWTSGYAFGTTHLIAVKYTYIAGSTNDEVKLFVNPTPGGSEPAATITSTDGGTGTDASTITGVYLRQTSASTMPTVIFDGIKAGTAWADVMPASGPAATFSITGTLSAFSQTTASPGPEQSYNIIGTDLTTNVTLVPPAGFEISKTSGSGFVTSLGSLVYSAAEVIAGKTIYVRLNSATNGSYSGNITHTSSGSEFTQANKSVSGSNTAKCVLSLTELIQARSTNGITMVPDSVTLELHDANTLALVDQDKELLSASGSGSFTFNSAINGTPYYLAIKHRNSLETWSANPISFSSFALNYNLTTATSLAYGNNLILIGSKYCVYSGDVNQDGFITTDDYTGIDNDASNFEYNLVNDVNGDGFITTDDYTCIDNNGANFISINAPSPLVPTPVFNITGSLSAFSQTSASASAEQTYNISGSNLTANVTLAPPAGFEISKTTGTGFVTSTGSLGYTAAEVMAGKTVYVRLHAGTTGSYSGNITHTSANSEFTQATKSVSGNYTLTKTFTITGTLSSFSQSSATPSAEQTYTIGGTNLTANVTLVPPASFEISKTTGTGFVTNSGSLVYTAAEVMAGKTIYVRMNAASPGNYSGNITHTSAASEFSVQNQSVSGLYSVPSGNVNLTMGNPSGATTDINFPHNYLLDKPEFCASYDKDRGIPNWTSWQLNSSWIVSNATRRDNYIPDGEVPGAWYHVNDVDYSGSGFARGHMCPSADRLNTQADNDSLFYYTNMVPQNQNNNGGTWEGLENYERTLAATNTVYIICGGYGAGGTKTDNSATVNTISNGKVTVPAKLWKVMIVIPNGSGSDVSRVTTSTRTIAMIIPNDSTPNSASTWGNYRVSVDSVEALTGYDFFSNVPTEIQAVIEANVDNGPTN